MTALLPQPHHVEPLSRPLPPKKNLLLWLEDPVRDAVASALPTLKEAWQAFCGGTLRMAARPDKADLMVALTTSDHATATWASEEDLARIEGRAGAYLMQVGPRIEIVGRDATGAFYGLHTLAQWMRLHAGVDELPGCRVVDAPDNDWRGVMIDLARDQRADVEWLERTIARLASYKINKIGLYLEHRFVSSVNKRFAPKGSLTPRQAKRLDAFARRHHVELIPYSNCLGHLEGFLMHEIAAEMAETPHNLIQMCPNHEPGVRFIETYLLELAACFSSPHFHLGADESSLLALCPTCRAQADRQGRDTLFVNHVNRLVRKLRKAGKTAIFWSDMCTRAHTGEEGERILQALDKELVVNIWVYSGPAREEIDRTLAHGFSRVLLSSCGGNAWIYSWVKNENMWGNVPVQCAEARDHGLLGVVNTVWEMFRGGCWDNSLLQVLLTADQAWNARETDRDEWEARVARLIFGLPEGKTFSKFVAAMGDDDVPYNDIFAYRRGLFSTRLPGCNYDIRRALPSVDLFAPDKHAQRYRDLERHQGRLERHFNLTQELLEQLRAKAVHNTQVLQAWAHALEIKRLGFKRIMDIKRMRRLYHALALRQDRGRRLTVRDLKEILALLRGWRADHARLAAITGWFEAHYTNSEVERLEMLAAPAEIARVEQMLRQIIKTQEPLPNFELLIQW